jgi:hypothetical protein
MDSIKTFVEIFGPAISVFSLIAIALATLGTRVQTTDRNLRFETMQRIQLVALLIQHKALPMEVLFDQLKDSNRLLVDISNDNIIQQVIQRYAGGSK